MWSTMLTHWWSGKKPKNLRENPTFGTPPSEKGPFSILGSTRRYNILPST